MKRRNKRKKEISDSSKLWILLDLYEAELHLPDKL
jgi:hypothetical protein